jgi:hypothetical protein
MGTSPSSLVLGVMTSRTGKSKTLGTCAELVACMTVLQQLLHRNSIADGRGHRGSIRAWVSNEDRGVRMVIL